MMINLQSQNSPSKNIIVPHFVFGSINWTITILFLLLNSDLLLGHHFNHKLIAITHLITLGWISTVIFGAIYQLIPVIFQTTLYSENLAKASFVSLQIGTWVFFFSFWYSNTSIPLVISAIILAISLLIFGINILKTILLSNLKAIERIFIFSSIIWLIFTGIIGTILAINLSFPFLSISHLELLKVHAHFGIIGWFSQLIIGVSIVLFPMFLLSHNQSKSPLKITLLFSNFGLIIGFCSIVLFSNYLLITAFISGVIALLPYLHFILFTYLKRIKKKVDLGMKKSLFSFIWISIALIVSSQVFLHFSEINQWQINLYITLFLLGFISTLIMGQTFKTLPFIIWLSNYKSSPSHSNKILPKDLYSHTILTWQYFSYSIGLILVAFGIFELNNPILIIGFSLLLIAVLLYVLNIFKIITRKNLSK